MPTALSTCVALEAIRCPRHGATMEREDPAKQPYIQRFCGAWWRCTEDRCQYTVLFESPELRAQHAAFKGAR